VMKYQHDPQIDVILKTSNSEVRNSLEKDIFNNVVKTTAVGLNKLYKSKNKQVQEDTLNGIKYLAQNLDGRSFT